MLKREDFLSKGYSEEQITELLNMFHNDRKKDVNEMENLRKTNSEISQKFNNVNGELQKIKNANLTEQEKIDNMFKEAQETINRANAREKSANIVYNKAKAKEILAPYNLNDELIDTLVSDDETTTLKNVNNWKSAIDNMNEMTTKKVREEISNVDVRPTQTNVTQNNDGMTKEKMQKLSLTELKMWKDENPELYEQLINQ